MVTVIHEQIKILVELQKIDGDIYQLRKELAEQPALKKHSEAVFEKKKANMKAAEEESKGVQLKQKQKEGELLAAEEKIKKLQAQLYQLKSNKEYTAMEMEIKGLKADKSLLEEDILRLLDAVDAAKLKTVKEKELLSVEEKKYKEELDQLKKREDEINAAAGVLEEKRKAFLPNLDAKLVATYEKLLKGREGMALVPVKNGACGGCHVDLPPQQRNEIQIADKVIVCESCARILYWPG